MGRKRARKRARSVTQPEAQQTGQIVATSVGSLPPIRQSAWAGDKFTGGFGATELLTMDYWTLRQRSSQLFETNLYARGLIRRLVGNIIHTGLNLEATPEEAILGMEEDSLADWSETVENRFALWSNSPRLCDYLEQNTFGEIQQNIEREALVAGDVLVVQRIDQRTGLPKIQLVRGDLIRTPMRDSRASTRIEHGVELDAQGRHVAYWVEQSDGTSKRLPAWGERSGRRLAWLVYGTDRRIGQVRGVPLLSLVLQSLKEIDRYRDSMQRKAVINSMLAMFVAKTQDKPGSMPIGGGAVRAGTQQAPSGQNDLPARNFQAAGLIPGMVIEELQHGETPHAFQTQGTLEQYGTFEAAIIQAVAWANDVPPEIMVMSFGSNYSASQASINEFKSFLNRERTRRGNSVCSPIYTEWLLSEVMSGRIKAPDLLAAWRDPSKYDTFAAWTSCDWSGNIKPAVDLSKLVRGYSEMVKEGFITRDRAARELTGTKYSKNVQKLARENEALAEALEPMAELERGSAPMPPTAEPSGGEDDDTGDDEDAASDGRSSDRRAISVSSVVS